MTSASGHPNRLHESDGLLDLFVGRYDVRQLFFRFDSYFPDFPNALLHNGGIVDGVPQFSDITTSAGVVGRPKPSLAAG